ncbi:hypothetical protein [Oceanobacillus sp. CFH 90083]|uniref:hypothetical protein n=1 Tax=Oceanobacillus sp. CFH 90083 TaxID=2592336 RepID=UPI00128C5CBF|nr:hypothetical protein [Oceanobacillus sp. CFH 90083]
MGAAIIICTIACIWFKGNKKPRAADMTLIIFAAVTLLITHDGTFIGAFFYSIAGIIGLVRQSSTGWIL